ncbi:MAG: DsbA family protein [Gemmatimonadaceae bacterium]
MSRLETTATAVLVVAAVVTASAVASRAWRDRPTSTGFPEAPEISSAQIVRAESLSFSFGDAAGAASMTVFSDLQCPACRQLHGVLRQLQRESSSGLRLRFVRFPLDYHPQARLLAQIVECADGDSTRSSYVDRVFSMQDSVGRLSDESVVQAIVGRSSEVSLCALHPADDPRFWRIGAGRALGDEIKLFGTPTIVVNGRIFESRPTTEALRKELRWPDPVGAPAR